MKRFLLLITAVAALALTACNPAPVEKAFEADSITATFNITLPGDDIATKAISDGAGATELLFRVFDANDRNLSELNQTVAVSGKKATVTAKLVRGVDYKFAFWAQTPGKYTLAADNNGHLAVTISPNALPAMMNDDSYDAFYAFKAVSAKDADFSENVTLYRPFAQINVGASPADISAATANALDVNSGLKTAFTIKGVKNSLDLITGKVSGSVDVTYSAAVAPTDNILTTDGAAFRRIAMVYVLAPTGQSATVQTTLNVTTKQNRDIDVAFAREVPNVPVLRNHRTNIVGEVFSLQGVFNVVVDENFDKPDKEIEIDVPAPAPVTYAVIIQESIDNGSVTIEDEMNEFEEGATVQLAVTPDNNYELAYLAYTPANGGEAVEIDLKTLSFLMPAFDVVVTARFSESAVPPTPSGEGSGTADDPYTVAGVRAFIDGLTAYPSADAVYVKGVVSKIASSPNASYSNASFYMTDPNGTDEFEAFRINYIDNAPWTTSLPMVAVGDEVVVFGKVTLYTPSSGGNSVYETYQKANEYNGYLSSVNGSSTTPTIADTPVITSADVTGAQTTQIGAGANDYLVVTISGSNVRYTTDGSDPTENSTAYTAPFNVSQACTVKAIAIGTGGALNSAIASLKITKAATPGGENGSGTATDPYTVAGVRAFIDGLTAYPSADAVYVKGVVSKIASSPNASYSNASFYMTDPNGTDEFEAFRINYFDNAPWTTSLPMVEVGNEVVVFGKVTLYTPSSGGNSVYETYQKANEYNGYLISVNGSSTTPTIADTPVITSADVTGAQTTQIGAGANDYLVVTISGSNVRYTTDGSDPTENSTAYTAPFNVSQACTVKAIAIGTGGALNSAIASLRITKASNPTPGGHSYVKVTATANITDGKYLIVYEPENVAFNGGLTTLDAAKNTIEVSPDNGVIDANETTDAAAFTISVADGTILSASGFYIGVTSYANGLKQNEKAVYKAQTFEIDGDGNAVITIPKVLQEDGATYDWDGNMILNFNSNANDKRFRYYKNGSQKKIQLYKYE